MNIARFVGLKIEYMIKAYKPVKFFKLNVGTTNLINRIKIVSNNPIDCWVCSPC